jgi:hypothetical protein
MGAITASRIKHIADAFIIIAKADHYMVKFASVATSEELEKAKGYLIVKSNAVGNRDELIEKALDLIENEIKGVKFIEGRK